MVYARSRTSIARGEEGLQTLKLTLECGSALDAEHEGVISALESRLEDACEDSRLKSAVEIDYLYHPEYLALNT